MFRKKYHLSFTYEELRLIIHVLLYRRAHMIEQGKFTDPIDELLIKFAGSCGELIA